MDIKAYSPENAEGVFGLWQTSGAKQGFVQTDEAGFNKLILQHKYFSASHAFVLTKDGTVHGFACGCTGDDLPKGNERGYFTCLLLSDKAEDDEENAAALLDALENSFKLLGKGFSACTFFNPMRLPWVIPGTENHLHNNAPGIAVDLPLYNLMLRRGYKEAARECAMHLPLDGFTLPAFFQDKARLAKDRGYTIEWFDKNLHTGLTEMVAATGNPQWIAEVPEAAEKINMLVALKGDEVVGFTGPVYPEESGRGYFAGIAVSAAHEGNGLGTLLFYRLVQAEKDAGAKYMSLFTGDDNHARRIYENAGFKVKRIFSVMLKNL